MALASAASASPLWEAPSDQMKTSIQAAFDAKLLDGQSARYRWPNENKNGVVYCGFVNAKNSFGAFTGFKPFYVLGLHANGARGDGSYKPLDVRLLDAEGLMTTNLLKQCVEAGFDMSALPE